LHAAFRQQRYSIRRAVANAVHRTITCQDPMLLESHAARSQKALLPRVEIMPLPSTTTSTSQIERTPRRRVTIKPTREDGTYLIHHTSGVRHQADSSPSTERPWVPLSDSSDTSSASHQADARVLHLRRRQRLRQAERLEKGPISYTLTLYDGSYKYIAAFMAGGSVLILGGTTLMLQAAQLTLQVKQIL
jgi:hypothetical protein